MLLTLLVIIIYMTKKLPRLSRTNPILTNLFINHYGKVPVIASVLSLI